ncbi:MAG: ABC transporter ATP-binding protein [Firmicutes bacterium]|nr:ABC transporter ATP-binding protein [Bacillota bacterium]
MIRCQNISVKYGGYFAVSQVELVLKKGEMVSLVGPNGSGKTTLLKTIARLISPSQGYIYLDGREILDLPTRQVAQRLSILSQQQVMPPDFTVEELVSYGRVPHRRIYQWLRGEDKEIVEWAMQESGIDGFASRQVNSLSGGERQRVWIAMALAQKPEVLLLDEPTTFLDICHQLEIMELLKKLNKQFNITILMVLHDLNQAAKYSNRMIALQEGSIIADGKPGFVLTEGFLRNVYHINAEIKVDQKTGRPSFIPLGLLC